MRNLKNKISVAFEKIIMWQYEGAPERNIVLTQEKIIQRFNEELGSDLKNLDKIHEFHNRLKAEKDEIEKSLSMASTEAPSKLKAVVEKVENAGIEIEQLQESLVQLQVTVEKIQHEDDKFEDFELDTKTVEKIGNLDKAVSYLNFLKHIENISDQMQTASLSNDYESIITLYTNLMNISCELQSSACIHLVKYVHETIYFWYNFLKNKLSREYCDILESLKWPFCSGNSSTVNIPPAETTTKFKILTEYLLHLQQPDEAIKPMVTSALLTNFAPVCLPVAFLVWPLRKRFIYHFTGAKLTNRVDKPEWFFTQVLTWIKDHAQWVHKNIQPIADSTGFNHIDVKVEFMRALVLLAVEKLHSELLKAQYDDALFAHLVDEALGFERELRETVLYPPNQPAIVFILTQAQIFVKWINMEKKFATEKMDAILSSSSAWDKLSGPDIDDMKVVECADAFLTLLTTISDRYKHLPQPGHRLQFLELQLELIDDWRVRLLQLLHEDYEDPLQSLMPLILNTFHYVANVLEEWGATVHFLQLQYFKKQSKTVETSSNEDSDITKGVNEVEGSVFDEPVELLRNLRKGLIDEISDSVALDVKAKSRAYRTDKWFAMQPAKEVASLSVTPSGCPMFQELAARLSTLHDVLALPLFHQAWKNLAAQFDEFLLEEVVLVNHFNTGGAEQLQYDIFRNLFPLFGLYINKPESYFPLIKEACVLLNILVGSAMLLLEALNSSDKATAKEILADVGVFKMSPEVAVKVIRTRTDITCV